MVLHGIPPPSFLNQPTPAHHRPPVDSPADIQAGLLEACHELVAARAICAGRDDHDTALLVTAIRDRLDRLLERLTEIGGA